MYCLASPCAAPTSTSTSGRMACSPPWRGARSPLGCAATARLAARAGGRAPAPFDPRDHDPATPRRASTAILIAPSSPLGIEWLPEAEALLDDFHARRARAGRAVRAVGGPRARRPDRPSASTRSSTRAPSVSPCPRARSAGPRASRASGRRWSGWRARGAAAVRPSRPGGRLAGLVPGADRVRRRDVDRLARVGAVGEARAPALQVVFAMLAGLAPLHAERLAARGGPSDAVHDRLTFFDTSSYGPRAIDAMLRVVGVDRLLYGSDRPVIEPVAAGGARRRGRARPLRHQPGAPRYERARRLRPGVPRP